MPLPKPPAKRADLLGREQFESQGAAAPGKSARRTRPAAEPVAPALLELRNEGELPAAPPSLPAVTQAPAPARSAPPRAAAGAGEEGGARQRPDHAVRARHQRADARPDVAVPLRGARHLPADDHPRGARRAQARHDRGGAQRPPGEPRPRRARRQHADAQRQGQERRHRPQPHRPARGRRQAVLPDRPDRRHPAGRPAAGQGRQPDPGRRQGARRAAARAATWCWCPRTSTCASRRVRWACPPRTTSTTRRSRTATCSTPACCSCPPTSGTSTARRSRAGSSRASPTTGSTGRSSRSC